jgi:hypothetical protein
MIDYYVGALSADICVLFAWFERSVRLEMNSSRLVDVQMFNCPLMALIFG